MTRKYDGKLIFRIGDERNEPVAPNPKGKRRIKRNIWGNWNGYIGRYKIQELGCSEFDAKEWLKEEEL